MSLSNRVWTDPRCTVLDLPMGMRGPFVDDGNGGILTTRGNQVQTSADGGKTWFKPCTLYDGPGPGVPGGGLLQRTRDGVIVYVFTDSSTFRWKWLTEQGEPAANIRIDVWSVRSLDGGKTWVDRQLVRAGYCRRPHHHDADQHRRGRDPDTGPVQQPWQARHPDLRLSRQRRLLGAQQHDRPRR